MLRTCAQCGMVFEHNRLPFHIREVHVPMRSRNAPVEPARPTATPRQAWKTRVAPPTHDVQEDRRSFKLEIQKLVHEFNTLPSQASHQCSNGVDDMPVLGALYAYTFTHLKLCAPNKESLLDDLENLKVGWVRDGDACILDLKIMTDGLNSILRKSQVERHICNTRLVNEHRLHDLDIHNIAALIVEYTTPEEHAHVFYHMAEDKAQYMVDTLQNLLMLQSERIEGYRKDLLNAIMRLSRKSGRFPQSLQLSHIRDLKETDLSGGFGVISRGKLNHRVVAVKKMKAGSRTQEQFLKDFCNEAVVWRHAQHPNCLPFYGVYVLKNEGSKLCLVSPWMTNGHVRDYLRTHPHTDRLPLVLDVACGLEYLHSMQPIVIHGDLKGANILITSSGRACLADFGIATVRDSHDQMTTTAFSPGGTYPFMAPELLRLENNVDVKNLDKCDIYAFGCVCYEIYTGKVPFHKKPSFILIPLVLNGERPERPTEPLYVRQGLDDDMWNFIGTLWAHDPTVRPTAVDACERISSKMLSKRKNPMRPQSTEVEWDVRFLSDAAVTVAAEDPFALAHT